MADYVSPEDLKPHLDNVVVPFRPEQPGTLRVTYARDIADEHHKVWLVDDFLGDGEYSVVYGLPGCGKSVFIGDGACHVGAGMPWFGRDVVHGVVVYLAAERAALVKRRVTAWKRHHGLDDLAVAIIDGVFDLCHGRAQADEIVRIANQAGDDFGLPVVWIIVDTKAQVMAGGDPNSDQEVGAFNANVRILQQGTGAHVTVVDHVPHTSPDRMKGSGALAGAADGSFLIKNEGFARTVTIGSKPPNDGPDDLDLAFSLEGIEIGVDPKGKVTTAPVVQPVEAGQALNPNRPLRGGKRKSEWVLILRAMGMMIDDGQAQRVPGVPGVPPGTMGVRQDQLRARAVKIGYTAGSGTEQVVRASFNREIRNMIAAELLRQEDQLVWRIAR